MDAGTRMLVQMSGARRFNRWMADTISPYIAGTVFEAGAGIGNLTEFLFHPGSPYIAAELEDENLALLRERFGSNDGLIIAKCDLMQARDLEAFRGRVDTVVCLNVLEHIQDDVLALQNLRVCLRCGGRAVILVPHGASAYGSLDRVLGHFRRYSSQQLEIALQRAGFHVERMIKFNRATYPGWIFNSRLLKRKALSGTQLALFDLLVPFWRRIDRFLPWPPTSLIAIASTEGC